MQTLKQNQINRALLALTVAGALLSMLVGVLYPRPVNTQAFVTETDLVFIRRQIEALQVSLASDAVSFAVTSDPSYSTPCYRAQGGAEWVADSGCTWGILSGAALEIQSGASVDAAGTFDFTGATITGLATDVTGDVTGTLTGDVVGNVTGDVTGTLTGDVVGNVTGDVTGTLTGAITGPITLTGALTTTGEIAYGANSLYPLGVSTAGYQIGFGSVLMTGTVTATHATGTPYSVHCTLETFSVDAAFCVALGSTGVVTATVYDITGTQSATGVRINWLIIGQP